MTAQRKEECGAEQIKLLKKKGKIYEKSKIEDEDIFE